MDLGGVVKVFNALNMTSSTSSLWYMSIFAIASLALQASELGPLIVELQNRSVININLANRWISAFLSLLR